jgi:hypothetical protein
MALLAEPEEEFSHEKEYSSAAGECKGKALKGRLSGGGKYLLGRLMVD